MMRMQHEFRGDHALQTELDFERRLAGRKAGAIGDTEYMGVDRQRAFAECHVEHDIGGLATRAWQ